jgi:hypothetical protein
VTYYTTDVPDTVSELFDGEVVIAHYGSGLYYSVSQGGALIWQGLRCGLSVSEIVEWLSGHFEAEAAAMPAQVEAFVAKLREERLLIEVSAREKIGERPTITVKTWREPVFESFDDLRELLLLDPIHEVTEAGWPHRPDDPA